MPVDEPPSIRQAEPDLLGLRPQAAVRFLRASALLTADFFSGEANFRRHGAANLTPSLALRVSSTGRIALVGAEGRAAVNFFPAISPHLPTNGNLSACPIV
jgi:hypothetical protein